MLNPANVTILIIDDNDVSRSMLRHILVNHKYRVVGEAGNGQIGLELARRLKPKLICLDIQMPLANGFDVLKAVKEILPKTAVLMVTGNNDRESIMESVRHGAAGYIVKPFNPGTLLRTIEQALDNPGVPAQTERASSETATKEGDSLPTVLVPNSVDNQE